MSMSGDDAYILSMDYTDERMEQVGGVTIDDENIKPNATWSSEKIARDYSTKEYVAEQILNTVHLVKEIVDAPPTVDEAKENVIYLVKDDTVTSGDVYKEYQLINGAVVQTGDTSIDLSGYAKLEDVENKTEIDDTATSTKTTWSSEKTQEEIENSTKSYFTINTLSNTKYIKIIPDNEQRHITIVSEDGECVEIFGDNDNGDQYTEECPKAVRLSYGAIQSFDASEKTANIERVFYNQTAGSKNFYVDCKSLLGYTIHGVKEQPKLVDGNSAEASQLLQQGLKEMPIISLIPEKDFYRVVTQGIAGYFKFKPTSNGIDQPLRISVTDNYGGMINISGATPSASQYKPFKCIRLSNGEYTNYDAIKVANNKMLKLLYYDGYFYLKVTTYTTCTFTGLVEAPTYVETLDETNAEEIPIRSVFDTPYNDGYADPSIIVIGDTASSDGVIKTLDSLGFTGDVMTWDTGVYRLSHVGGLTNLPAEITEEKPGLRIEHYDMKKWGSNHNPHVSTYGCRQSILHYKGDVYVRYTESGASAGVLIADTGWNNISNKKSIKFNSKTFKIDITKGNENWNGNMKFGYCIDESYGEIIISSLGKTEVMWDHSTGVRYVKSVTYTIDPNNKAHITIGIELYDVSYGIHQLEIIGDFARVNSITGDTFTGTSVAKRGATRGRNNGVGILCNVEDLGLTTPCTTVQIAQAMRNLANKMTRIPASGMIGIFEGDKSLITDAPYDYGLLHIECCGYDRILIRFEGIGSSSYKGSWIGKIIGSGGTFSGIDWEQFGYNDVALTTIAIPNSYITGTLQWEVKKGICYVSWENFKCTKTNFTYTLTNNKLPTPLRTACLPMYASTGEHIGVINIPKDGSTPTFVSTDKISLASSGCFGYEIA